VEVVQGGGEIGESGGIQWELRGWRERFLTSRVGREVGGNRQVEKDFHFSAGPTVTAGFMGFAFDIR
jgi:hypothetical protein